MVYNLFSITYYQVTLKVQEKAYKEKKCMFINQTKKICLTFKIFFFLFDR